jgi:phosphoribosylformylglycinamidine synthase
MLVSKAMRVYVYVTPKRTVLDPQGQAVRRALNSMGHTEITDIRQGKYFEVDLEDGLSAEQARKKVEQIAEDVLSNPVIESYRVEIAG